MSDSILSQRWPWILAALLVIGIYASTAIRLPSSEGAVTTPGADRPVGTLEDIRAFAERDDTNVLFVLIDTLRAERMGTYGYERDTTPFLDKVAAKGIRFDRHLAQSSWTKCSMASMWTGLYPPRTGVTRFNHALPDEAEMPAEIFKENGFQTVAIYRNGWVSGYFGFEQGFDVYAKPTARQVPAAVRRENPTLTHQGTDIDVVETGVEFLRLHGDKRWLLYLHLMDVHEYIYDEESAVFGTSNSDTYDQAILHEDYVMETLFAHLDQLGLTEKTLVVIGSDHGEAFGERGIEGHARAVHRETTEVPLIFSFPFALEEGVAIQGRTANVDLWPTLLDLVGLPPLADDIDGVSRVDDILAGGFRDPSEPDRAFAYLDQTWGTQGVASQPSIAVVDGPIRFVNGHEKGFWQSTLFDADKDPQERRNLAKSEPDLLAEFADIAREHGLQEPSWSEAAPELEIDEMELNQLRALGYQIP